MTGSGAGASVVLLTAVLSFSAVGIVLVIARRKALLAIPEARSNHTAPTPSGGGIGIVIAIVLSALLSQQCRLASLWLDAPWLARASFVVAILVATATGIADDRRALRPGPKMLLIVIAAALALPAGAVRAVDLPWYGRLYLGPLAIPLSAFWLVGFTNAFNFMDGINGIAGITLVITGVAFVIAGAEHGDTDTLQSGALVAGGALGFLPWNFPRARIFMGDAGSLPLGLLVASIAIRASRDNGGRTVASLSFPACCLLLGPYVFDVSFTLFRRRREHKPLAHAHSEHLYQRLARGTRSHAISTLAVGVLEIGAAALALTYDSRGSLGQALSLLLPAAALLALAPLVLQYEATAAANASTIQKG